MFQLVSNGFNFKYLFDDLSCMDILIVHALHSVNVQCILKIGHFRSLH